MYGFVKLFLDLCVVVFLHMYPQLTIMLKILAGIVRGHLIKTVSQKIATCYGKFKTNQTVVLRVWALEWLYSPSEDLVVSLYLA